MKEKNYYFKNKNNNWDAEIIEFSQNFHIYETNEFYKMLGDYVLLFTNNLVLIGTLKECEDKRIYLIIEYIKGFQYFFKLQKEPENDYYISPG